MISLRVPSEGEWTRVRGEFHGAALPAVIVPEMVSEEDAARLRAEVVADDLATQTLAHRGRYASNDTRRDDPLLAAIGALATGVTGRALSVASFRWARLVRGDYAMLRDDGADDACVLEATLDFSARASGAAELCYCRHGRLVCALPQLPRSVCVVARAPGIRRYERYLGHRVGDVEVYRLTVRLRAVTAL